MPEANRDKAVATIDGASFETLSMQICHALQQEIVTGQFAPGTRLVRRALSRRFGVSPIPVTEALFRLEQDGLIESEPMYGARVKLATPETLQNDQVLREAIECQIARICAENTTAEQFDQLNALAIPLDAMASQSQKHTPEGADLHFKFHMTLARFARCHILTQTLERVWFRRLMQFAWVQSAAFPTPKDWHTTLINALRTRDPERAEAAMRAHVRFNNNKHHAALERLNQTAIPQRKTRAGMPG